MAQQNPPNIPPNPNPNPTALLRANPNPPPIPPRVDIGFVPLSQLVACPQKTKEFMIEHGLAAPESLGKVGTLPVLGYTRTGKPVYAVCSSLPYNANKPYCQGNITYILHEGKYGKYYCTSCKASRSVDHGTTVVGGAGKPSFFSHMDKLGRTHRGVDFGKMLLFLHLIANEFSLRHIHDLLGGMDTELSPNTVNDWFSYVRELCELELDNAPLMGGPNAVIQADECYMLGKRKNNKGRLRPGNVQMANGNRRNNYNNKHEGPWVFGLYDSNTRETRFFWLPDRKKETLNYYIENNVRVGSTIHTDEWKGYLGIPNLGMTHKSVNHSKNFVAPDGTHTQGIERAWVKIKSRIVKEGRGTKGEMMSSHCAFHWWLSINGKHRCKDPFFRLLDLIKKHYPQ